MLSMLYREEYNHGYNVLADPLGRAFAAARRAVDAAPSNHLAHHALASVLFFRREKAAFRSAAQRAIELNRMDGFTIGYMGFLMSYSGDWERGCGLMEEARKLNPNHPGWYWFPPFFNAYRKGDYRAALEFALKVNMPGFWRNELALAATYGQLGEFELANRAACELLEARPGFDAVAREECAKWWEPELVEQIMDGLRKAGLEIADAVGSPASGSSDKTFLSSTSQAARPAASSSGAVRADEGFWVAVLPFKYTGGNADITALAEGLSDEVVTGLSRFSYLRVIARGSTAHYANQQIDLRTVGKELGARYVMEGNIRQAGAKLRIAVQLVDTTDGAHLWAQTYEREFSPEAIFELQDELAPRIVSTVADQYGVLPRSMNAIVRAKNIADLTAHESVLYAFGYFERISEQEHGKVRDVLEAAVAKAPDNADCWAMLSLIYRGEFAQEYNMRPRPLERALEAAQRAIVLAPSSHLGHWSQAVTLFFLKEPAAFRTAAERAMALNPMDGSALSLIGLMTASIGEWERGCAMVARAREMNPNHPGHYYFAPAAKAYRDGDYEASVQALLRCNMPNYFYAAAMRAAALGKLGRTDAARQALNTLLAQRPNFAATVRHDIGKWYDDALTEDIVDGLRKAGMEIRDAEG
jgi:TolB-like protein/Flp pilus assembly protein TadD